MVSTKGEQSTIGMMQAQGARRGRCGATGHVKASSSRRSGFGHSVRAGSMNRRVEVPVLRHRTGRCSGLLSEMHVRQRRRNASRRYRSVFGQTAVGGAQLPAAAVRQAPNTSTRTSAVQRGGIQNRRFVDEAAGTSAIISASPAIGAATRLYACSIPIVVHCADDSCSTPIRDHDCASHQSVAAGSARVSYAMTGARMAEVAAVVVDHDRSRFDNPGASKYSRDGCQTHNGDVAFHGAASWKMLRRPGFAALSVR